MYADARLLLSRSTEELDQSSKGILMAALLDTYIHNELVSLINCWNNAKLSTTFDQLLGRLLSSPGILYVIESGGWSVAKEDIESGCSSRELR